MILLGCLLHCAFLPTPSSCATKDSAAAVAFLTTFMNAQPARLRVSRAALAVACAGRPVATVGYGKTAAGQPVDGNRTIFRAASNSKLVTAVAVLQLAESGAWRLTDEVNSYLAADEQLAPRGLRAPVRIEHLLTHTAGLESRFGGLLGVAGDSLSLHDYFRRHPPRRAAEPGAELAYSNVGIALAGYLVERRSRTDFAAYAARHVFAPLGMTRSTFAQVVPTEWARDLAGGEPPRGRRLFFNGYPAASLLATPADMARFIAALLNGGALAAAAGGGRILQPQGVSLMQAAHWRAQPDANGVAYGFFEGVLAGRRILFHTGDSGDHSLVLLFPSDSVGIYFVYSGTDEQTELREHLARAFAGSLPPSRARTSDVLGAVSEPPAGTPPHATVGLQRDALAGIYRTASYSRSNYEKVAAVFAHVRLAQLEDGSLLARPPGSESPIRLRRVSALTFRGDSGEIVAFRVGGGGRVDGFTLSGSIWDPSSWDRVGMLDDGQTHIVIFTSSVALLAVRLLLWPAVALLQRAGIGRRHEMSRLTKRVWRLSGVAAGLFLAAPVVAGGVAFLSFTHPVRAIPRAVAIGSLIAFAGLATGVVAAGLGCAPSVARSLPRMRRAYMVAFGGACVMLFVLLWYWNLLPPMSFG